MDGLGPSGTRGLAPAAKAGLASAMAAAVSAVDAMVANVTFVIVDTSCVAKGGRLAGLSSAGLAPMIGFVVSCCPI
jgi:hypothetical protein